MENGCGDGTPGGEAAGSRRSLLRAATGGFALAASGLLLPEWLVEEAVADNHPVRGVQNRKQQKRDKRRHKREHNRRLKRRKQNTGAGVGSGEDRFFSGIRFHVYNDHAAASHVDFYEYGPRVTLGPDVWQDWGAETIQPGGSATKSTVFQTEAMLIEGRYWIMADNPAVGWPTIYFAYGGRRSTSDRTFHGYEQGTILIHDVGLVPTFSLQRTVDGRRFTITRNWDEGSGQTYISFDVRYT